MIIDFSPYNSTLVDALYERHEMDERQLEGALALTAGVTQVEGSGPGSQASTRSSLSGSSSQNNVTDGGLGAKIGQEQRFKQKQQLVNTSFSLLSLSAGSATIPGPNITKEGWNSPSSSTLPSAAVSPCNAHIKYTPYPDLWFQDGSVILATESSLFRVHISVLSRHSLFFRDMFRLPQPPQIPSQRLSPGVDDLELDWEDLGMQCGESKCPVVQLHDSAEDLANLLFALYDGP